MMYMIQSLYEVSSYLQKMIYYFDRYQRNQSLYLNNKLSSQCFCEYELLSQRNNDTTVCLKRLFVKLFPLSGSAAVPMKI